MSVYVTVAGVWTGRAHLEPACCTLLGEQAPGIWDRSALRSELGSVTCRQWALLPRNLILPVFHPLKVRPLLPKMIFLSLSLNFPKIGLCLQTQGSPETGFRIPPLTLHHKQGISPVNFLLFFPVSKSFILKPSLKYLHRTSGTHAWGILALDRNKGCIALLCSEHNCLHVNWHEGCNGGWRGPSAFFGLPQIRKIHGQHLSRSQRLALETAPAKDPYPLPARSLPAPLSHAQSGAAPGSLISRALTAAPSSCLRRFDEARVLGWAVASVHFPTCVPELCPLAIPWAHKRALVLGLSSCSPARTHACSEMSNNKNTALF